MAEEVREKGQGTGERGQETGEKNCILWQDRQRVWFFGLPLTFTKYTLTHDKLKIDKGFFTRQHDEVRMYRVLDVSVKETLGQRLVGVGDIRVKTSDKTLKDFVMKNIKHPIKILDLISETAEAERGAKRVSTREYIGGGSDNDGDLDDEGREDNE